MTLDDTSKESAQLSEKLFRSQSQEREVASMPFITFEAVCKSKKCNSMVRSIGCISVS